MVAFRTFQRGVTKGRKDSSSPLVEIPIDAMFGPMNRTMKFWICFSVPCIENVISNHFKVFLRDVSDETFDEINSRDSFFHIFFVFMAIVMKSNEFTTILINSGSGNNRTTDILDNVLRIAFVRFCIDIETDFTFLKEEPKQDSNSLSSAVRKALRK